MPTFNNQTWLISDTHLGHDNIIKYCARPENHEDQILDAWEDLIAEDDVILHLGDVWFGRGTNPARWAELISNLPGKKYLVLGNHDKSSKRFYTEAGFEIIPPFVQDSVAFTHYPIKGYVKEKYLPPAGEEWNANIHGHVHNNVTYGPEGRIIGGKTYINVSVEMTDYKPIRIGDVCAIMPA